MAKTSNNMLGGYNGFTGPDRNRLANLQRKAIEAGAMRAPALCEICGQTQGRLMLHNEDYDRPEAAHPLCVECYMRLRARFYKPRTWHNYLARIAAGSMSRPYRTEGAFLAANRGPDESRMDPWENPRDAWYRRLPMQPVNFRALDEAAKEYFR